MSSPSRGYPGFESNRESYTQPQRQHARRGHDKELIMIGVLILLLLAAAAYMYGVDGADIIIPQPVLPWTLCCVVPIALMSRLTQSILSVSVFIYSSYPRW